MESRGSPLIEGGRVFIKSNYQINGEDSHGDVLLKLGSAPETLEEFFVAALAAPFLLPRKTHLAL